MTALRIVGGHAWFVGGCVRDSLLEPNIETVDLDIDVATDLLPAQTMAALRRAGMKAIPTGIEHGTVTAVVVGQRFEVTTLRRDVSTDGRHAVVAFGTGLKDDAQRRDFTINAIYAEADGEVVDPLGGLADLLAARVRFVGDPDQRILEDHLRILRFFRFHARFGNHVFDGAGLAACIRHRERLRCLSAERIAKELMKLVMAPGCVISLRAMKDGGILEALDLQEADPARLEALQRLGVDSDAVLRLAALFRQRSARPGVGKRVAARLKLSAACSKRMEAALSDELVPVAESEASFRRRWYKEGVGSWRDRFVLAAALAHASADQVARTLDEAARWVRPVFPISGDDLLELGITAGPSLGRHLREVEDWWIDLQMMPDRQACLAHLESLLPHLTNPPRTP